MLPDLAGEPLGTEACAGDRGCGCGDGDIRWEADRLVCPAAMCWSVLATGRLVCAFIHGGSLAGVSSGSGSGSACKGSGAGGMGSGSVICEKVVTLSL